MTNEDKLVNDQIKLFQLDSKSFFHTALGSIPKSTDLEHSLLSSKFQQDQ